MTPIYIPQLAKAHQQTETLHLRQHIDGFETLTPVQGQLSVTHHGNYLEARATVETIVTLTCDRCLQNYNQRLTLNTSELIWLEEEFDPEATDELEAELAADDLVESLPPTGYFDPQEWLYEHLCLALPHRQLCDQGCPGIEVDAETRTGVEAGLPVDSRWASLAALKGELLN